MARAILVIHPEKAPDGKLRIIVCDVPSDYEVFRPKISWVNAELWSGRKNGRDYPDLPVVDQDHELLFSEVGEERAKAYKDWEPGTSVYYFVRVE